MTVCKHCFIDSATLAAQSERINVLEQEKAELLELLVGAKEVLPAIAGLSPSEGRILAALMTHERMSREALFHISGSRANDGTKIVDVWICKLRKKIRPLGLDTKNIWGEGYYIPREQKDALKAEAA